MFRRLRVAWKERNHPRVVVKPRTVLVLGGLNVPILFERCLLYAGVRLGHMVETSRRGRLETPGQFWTTPFLEFLVTHPLVCVLSNGTFGVHYG